MRYIAISALIVFLAIFSVKVMAADATQITSSFSQIQTQSSPIYTEPDTQSKVVMTLKKGQIIIPFFQQGDWMKIANPQTGDVGWVQKTNLAQGATITALSNPGAQEFTVTQKDDKGNAIHSYRINVYSDTKTLTPEQSQAMYTQFLQQQRLLQESFNKMMNDAYQSFNRVFPDVFSHAEFPFLSPFQPVIIIHEQDKTLREAQTPSNTANKTTATIKK